MRVWRAVAGDRDHQHVELVQVIRLPDGRTGFALDAAGRLARLVRTGGELRLEQSGRTLTGRATVVRSGRPYDDVRERLHAELGLLDRLRLRRTDAVVLVESAPDP